MTIIMTEMTAAEAMKPLSEPIRSDSTASAARQRMTHEDLSFLVVVSAETEEMLGVVLRGALERACEANGHDPASCPLSLHVKTDVDVCFAGDRTEEALARVHEPSPQGGAAARRARARRRLPVLVVSEQNVPLGYLERG